MRGSFCLPSRRSHPLQAPIETPAATVRCSPRPPATPPAPPRGRPTPTAGTAPQRAAAASWRPAHASSPAGNRSLRFQEVEVWGMVNSEVGLRFSRWVSVYTQRETLSPTLHITPPAMAPGAQRAIGRCQFGNAAVAVFGVLCSLGCLTSLPSPMMGVPTVSAVCDASCHTSFRGSCDNSAVVSWYAASATTT